jgi:hypothetical protein
LVDALEDQGYCTQEILNKLINTFNVAEEIAKDACEWTNENET